MKVFKKLFVIILFVLMVQHTHAQVLRIATYQYADNNRVSNLQPLGTYLEHHLGCKTEVKSYPSIGFLVKAIQQNEVDIAFISTFGFLQLEADPKKYPMQARFTFQFGPGGNAYKTAIITHKDQEITSLAEIKKHAAGSRLVLVNKSSTTGNLVPRAALGGAGIHHAEKAFKTVAYGQNHEATIDSLILNKADFAAVGSYSYQSFLQKSAERDKVKLIWMSPEIPFGPVLVNKNLSDDHKTIIMQAFVKLHQFAPAVFSSIKDAWVEAKQGEKFVEIDKSYYNPFKKSIGSNVNFEAILNEFGG